MKDLNSGMLIGRLTKDCTIDYLNSGSAKTEVSIAFTTSKKSGNEWVDETNYVNTQLWGKTAENLTQYLKKGILVGIQYHLKQDRWEKDGKKGSALKPIIDEIQLLSRPQVKADLSNQETPMNVSEEEGDFKEDLPF